MRGVGSSSVERLCPVPVVQAREPSLRMFVRRYEAEAGPTQAKGSVLIHQKMFESRLFFVDKLIDMGAQIILCDPHRATVIGLNRKNALRGIQMTSPDIRAGVSLLIAALSAKGKSIIHNIEQIDRGYQDIDIRLNNIGADIRRIG